jgi:hypothetical protein
MLCNINWDIIFKYDVMENTLEEVVVAFSSPCSDIYGRCVADLQKLLMLM